ncbi:MAG: VWA domain-containing protein [Candidatus Omnitrophica bacterium]|nr:VWA domain-containing protein [Candidatus Omnitrophota bacterium]
MRSVHFFILFGAFAIVIWRARDIPLAGWRWPAVLGCHLAALAVLGAALWGPPRRRLQEVPRHVVYLVDRSASMDAAQRAWVARRIAALEALRPAQMPRAMAVFGSDARLAVPFSRERLTDAARVQHALEASAVDAAQTNLETALLFSAALLPPQQGGGIVLFSDGRETTGDAASMLSYLQRFSVGVFAQPPPAPGRAQAVWEVLSVPPVVQRGATVPVKLVVFNAASAAKAGQVTVAVQGVPMKRQRIVVRPGWQVVTVPLRALVRGTMAMEVQLDLPADRLSERRSAYTEVEGPPQLLFLAEQSESLPPLAQALKRRDMDLAVMRPSEFPQQAQPLGGYDAILAFNLPKSALSAGQVAALRSYLETSGGGLVTVGLGGALADELKHAAALDALLPVTFEPKGMQETKQRICFIMLIDRSASMLGPRIAATKRAAVELVKQLQPEDLVGVLAFDTEAYVVAEVQPARQIDAWLVEKLVKLRSTGGTDILPALAAAANRLEATGATTKHVILLSDGNTPFQKVAYDAMMKQFKDEKMTLSTIGIGPAFVNTDLLQWLAGSTGGSYYLMRRPEELPRLVVQDTQEQLGKLPFAEGYFRPVRSPSSDWFAEIDPWPSLRGFFTATAKPQARVDLTIDGGTGPEPLLARWTVGRGRVVSFLSDAHTRWSPEWIRWEAFEGVWAQVVRWAARPRLTEELFVWMDASRAAPSLMIEGMLDNPKAELLNAQGSQRTPLSLMQAGRWRWQAALEQVPSGWYQLVLESTQGQATVTAKRWVQVGTPPQGPELAGQPPHEALLRQIARATGGTYAMPNAALAPPTTTAHVAEPLFTWWLPLVILLLLLEVALRGSSML